MSGVNSPPSKAGEARTLCNAVNENRLVANRLLLRMNGCNILTHGFTADLHVAHGVIAVVLGAALPNVHGMGHQLAHGGLKVVIANHTAGNTRRPGADARFVENDDVVPDTLTGRFELQRKVVGSAQTVNSSTNNDVRAVCWNCLLYTSPSPRDRTRSRMPSSA